MKFQSNAIFNGTITANSVADAGTNTDKFLVLNSSGLVTYRTAAELYTDLGIGSLPAGYTQTLKHQVKAGVAVTKGQAVYVTSADGTNMIVGLASNAAESTSSKTLGLIESTLSINGIGNVITEGLLAGLDTTGANAAGDPVWLGANGNLIYGLSNKPSAPNHLVFIGVVTRINANNGEIFVKVQNGFELGELHNYAEGSVQNNQVITYESATSLYKPKSIATILGYTPANAATYVPYTGATTNVNLGGYNLTGYTLNGNQGLKVEGYGGEGGYLAFKQYAVNNLLGYGYTSISANSTNILSFLFAQSSPYDAKQFKLDVAGLTTNDWRTYTMPNADGTLALTSDIPSLTNYVTTNTNQTITGIKTFTNEQLFGNGITLTGGYITYTSGSYNLTLNTNILTANRNVFLQDGSGTLAFLSDIPSVSGFINGSGTTNTLPKFTGTSAIGNSNITDTGSLITLGSNTYVNGAMGFGTSTVGSYIIRIVSPLTGGTTTYGISNAPIIQSSVTSAASIYRTAPQTQAASFTLSNLNHFFAEQSVIGAGSVVTNQIGFYADNSLIGATNNYGFYGSIPNGANRWNIYMIGTANNYLAGSLGIGSTGLTGYNLRVEKNITGGTTAYGILVAGPIQSDVTNIAYLSRTTASTQAASFTLAGLYHYTATTGTIGAGSSITTQVGFYVPSTTIGATNNYAFSGQLAAAANTWNLYMGGTANNYMAGNLAIGSAAANSNLYVVKNITGGWVGSPTYGANIFSSGAIQSDVTNTGYYNVTRPSTAATTFTLTNLASYSASTITIGAGSTVTNTVGFWVESTHIGGTNNYGFYGGLAAAANTWNLYMGGTASNYLNGVLTIGTASPNASAKVQIDSTTQGFLPPRMTSAQRTAISTPATGLMVYQTDGTQGVYVYTSAGWKSLTMV